MIKLYLNEDMREAILNHDIEYSEDSYDRNMWYIQSSEKDILYHCICGWLHDLERLGFKERDINLLKMGEFEVEFTNKKNYYIKQIN